MSESRRSRRGEGYGACDAADREKGICPLAKFATKRSPLKAKLCGGEEVTVSVAFIRSTALGKNNSLGCLAEKQSLLCAE